jgi:uncharacterized protein (TIGR02246 family)
VKLAGDKAKAAEVWKAFERWLGAYQQGDLKGVMAIFDRDVLFSYQGAADQGLGELEAGYVADFQRRQPGSAWAPKVEEVYADGRLAFVRAVWERRVPGAGGRAETAARNRSLDVFRRSDDGAWRIFRSFNYPEKP